MLELVASASTKIVQVPDWLDLASVFAGGLMGAVAAVKERFDLAGVAGLAVVTGLGGGIIRDGLLNVVPAAIQGSSYLVTALVAAAAGFFFASLVSRFASLLIPIDAIALGLFGVVGANKALANGIEFVPAVLIGVLAAVGGGLLRDVITSQPPLAFVPGTLYTTAAALGVVLYATLDELDVALGIAVTLSTGFVFALRMVAVWRGWHAPRPVDATKVLTTVIGAGDKGPDPPRDAP